MSEPDFDERVMMTALRMLADARLIDVMPFRGIDDGILVRDRARELVKEYSNRPATAGE